MPSFSSGSFATGVSGMSTIAENPDSSYNKILSRMQNNSSPTLSEISENTQTSDSSDGSAKNDR